jgi:hypothetical protein
MCRQVRGGAQEAAAAPFVMASLVQGLSCTPRCCSTWQASHLARTSAALTSAAVESAREAPADCFIPGPRVASAGKPQIDAVPKGCAFAGVPLREIDPALLIFLTFMLLAAISPSQGKKYQEI